MEGKYFEITMSDVGHAGEVDAPDDEQADEEGKIHRLALPLAESGQDHCGHDSEERVSEGSDSDDLS